MNQTKAIVLGTLTLLGLVLLVRCGLPVEEGGQIELNDRHRGAKKASEPGEELPKSANGGKIAPPELTAPSAKVSSQQASRSRTTAATRQERAVDHPASDSAATVRVLDRDLPWVWPGQCLDESESASRVDYLLTFQMRRIEDATVYAAPGVEEEQLEHLTTVLADTHRAATRSLSVEAPIPKIYLHASATQLREHACVPESAVAYYDGAIHIAVLDSVREMERSFRHEYAHHVLASQGIGRPVWLHEGFAMSFARDEPLGAYRTWREHPVDLAQMVEPLSSDWSDEEVQVFYAQAAVMYDFLGRLCLNQSPCGAGDLARALVNEETVPDELFLWGTARYSDDLGEAGPLRFWQDYEKAGNFPPDAYQRLLNRGRPKR